MSQPPESTSAQRNQLTWGIQRTQQQDGGTGTTRGRGRQPLTRGSRRRIGAGSSRAARTGGGAAGPSNVRTVPNITRQIEALLAREADTRGAQSVDDVLSSLGEAFVDQGRVEWVLPDDIDPVLARYLTASVEELNNNLDAGLATIDDNGEISLTMTTSIPDGSYVTSIESGNQLFIVRDGRRQLVQDARELEEISQADIQQVSPLALSLIPIETSAGRAVGRDLYAYHWSDLRSGHFMQSWVWLQGTTLTVRTITESVTWFGGYTGGVRVDLYDADGRQLQYDPIRFSYGCDGRFFGSGQRDETEVVQLSEEIANATESFLISHYWDPKRSLVDTLIEAAEFLLWAYKQIEEAQQQGEQVSAGTGS